MRRDLTLVAMGGNLHAAAAPARKGAAFTLDERKALAAAFEDLYGLPVPPASFLDTKRRKADYRYFDSLPTPVITAKKLRLARVEGPLPAPRPPRPGLFPRAARRPERRHRRGRLRLRDLRGHGPGALSRGPHPR